MDIFLGYILSLAYGGICLAAALIAYKLGVPKSYTRKIVHILVGFEWVILNAFHGPSIHFIIVCILFTALLFASHKKSLMPMISSDGENAPGTVYYGVAMTVMAVISYFEPAYIYPFGIAVFCTSIGDGFAGVIGAAVKRCNPKIYKNKTLVGFFAGFAFSFLSTLIFSSVFSLGLHPLSIAAIALLSSGLELITGFGLDNITISLGTSAFAYLLINYPAAPNYIIPIIITPFVIAAVLSKNALTVRGVAVAVVMDIIVSLAFGNFGFVLLLSFLLLSIIIDKVKKHLRPVKDEISKRGEHRDEVQVIANGSIPVIMAVLYIFTRNPIFVLAYTASLTECFSDTCASGVGAASRIAFDIFRMKKVPVGLSGGVSVMGTLASLTAAFAFPLIALAFGAIDEKMLLIAAVSAFAGALFDSLLGSLFQVKYRCNSCGIVTEKNEHCGVNTEKISGISLVTNDVVNVLSCMFAAVLAIVIYLSI